MSQKTKGDGPSPAPGGKQVITFVTGYEETGGERLLKKIIPACVISGALHVAIAATFLLFGKMFGSAEAKPMEPPVPMALETEEEKPVEKDLTKTNESKLEQESDPSIEVTREANVTIDTPKVTEDPIGDPTVNSSIVQDSMKAMGNPTENVVDPGMKVDGPGMGALGDGGFGGVGTANPTLGGRSAATRDKLTKSNGGSEGSELAVGRGLAWLAKAQRPDGAWEFDGSDSKDLAASTGLALLPFLAAGQTHKSADLNNKYKDTVGRGLAALVKLQKPDGSFKSSSNMYSHAIASVALCEAYGMTQDKVFLLRPAQASINHIMAGQGTNGSWGYQAKSNGDTSIVGWQIQALQSAKLCKDMVVDKRVLDKARSFLDSVASGSKKSKYGYSSPGAGTSLTAVGLLCRYYMDGWGPNNPGMSEGVDFLRKSIMPGKGKALDMYYYYYATQVMHFYDGDEWKEWNPLMRDWLIDLQVKNVNNANTYGSWEKDASWIGNSCGRLGTTCMALLTLEVYYRHIPLYKRDTGGLKELERGGK